LLELLEIRAKCNEADVVDLLDSMGSGFRPEVDANVGVRSSWSATMPNPWSVGLRV